MAIGGAVSQTAVEAWDKRWVTREGRFALAELMGEAPWLAGTAITLADLHAAPIVSVFRLAPETAGLLGREIRLREWWKRVSTRASFLRTQVAARHESHSAGAV